MFEINLNQPHAQETIESLSHIVNGLEKNNVIFTLHEAPIGRGNRCEFRVWGTGKTDSNTYDVRDFVLWDRLNDPWLLAVIIGTSKETVEKACSSFFLHKKKFGVASQVTNCKCWSWREP